MAKKPAPQFGGAGVPERNNDMALPTKFLIKVSSETGAPDLTATATYDHHDRLVGLSIDYADNQVEDGEMGHDSRSAQYLLNVIKGNALALKLETAYRPRWQVDPVAIDLSFEAFWNAYAYKQGDRKRAKRLWESLSDVEAARVFRAIKAYNFHLAKHPQRQRLLPETFLAQRRFENDFNS